MAGFVRGLADGSCLAMAACAGITDTPDINQFYWFDGKRACRPVTGLVNGAAMVCRLFFR